MFGDVYSKSIDCAEWAYLISWKKNIKCVQHQQYTMCVLWVAFFWFLQLLFIWCDFFAMQLITKMLLLFVLCEYTYCKEFYHYSPLDSLWRKKKIATKLYKDHEKENSNQRGQRLLLISCFVNPPNTRICLLPTSHQYNAVLASQNRN